MPNSMTRMRQRAGVAIPLILEELTHSMWSQILAAKTLQVPTWKPPSMQTVWMVSQRGSAQKRWALVQAFPTAAAYLSSAGLQTLQKFTCELDT